MNSFIKPSLKVLLSLVLPEKQYTLQRRLDPVLHYLARHLSALADGLYPQSFLALLQCMWDFLISVRLLMFLLVVVFIPEWLYRISRR